MEEMTRDEFKALLSLFMASDPSPVSDEEDVLVRELLNRISYEQGFDSWEIAFHEV